MLKPVPDGQGFGDNANVWRAYCEAKLGKVGEARTRLDVLIASRSRRYIAGDLISQGYIGIGDFDAAFKWLDVAFRDRGGGMYFLFGPQFDSIRSDPRFKALEARVAAAANKAP